MVYLQNYRKKLFLNISAIYEAIVEIFSVNHPMVFINKFYTKKSTTRRTSRTSSRWSSTKKVLAKQNFIKDTGPENIVFVKLLWKRSKLCLFWFVTSILNFFLQFLENNCIIFLVSRKCARVFRSFGHFVFMKFL